MLKTEIMIFSKYKILLNSNLLNYGSKMRRTAKKQRTSKEVLCFLSNPKDWYIIECITKTLKNKYASFGRFQN